VRRAAAAVGVLVLAAALTGCGLGAGKAATGVTLIVSRDFGAHRIGSAGSDSVHGSDTVMRLLERSFRVRTRYGGRFVQAIDGLAGGTPDGRPSDWFYYVNGLEAPQGAAATGLRDGDRIIWDYHDWQATQSVPAIVGAFPQPLRRGAGAKRLPVRIECGPDDNAACDTAAARLGAAGVDSARGTVGSGSETASYRVLVGTVTELSSDPAAARLSRGPRGSGVYTIPRAHGRALALLDVRGRTVRTLGAGTGLVAVVRPPGSQPVWLVTGTDGAGVRLAAAALTRRALGGRFAVVVRAGRVTGIPEARG
jgi:hypothetical protein